MIQQTSETEQTRRFDGTFDLTDADLAQVQGSLGGDSDRWQFHNDWEYQGYRQDDWEHRHDHRWFHRDHDNWERR